MERLHALGGGEFAPASTYLNTAVCGLLPRRTVRAVTRLAEELAEGRPGGSGESGAVDATRRSFARLTGVDEGRVAVGGSVSVHVGLIAASMPPGAEVLFPEGEYASVITPFTVRGDLKLRYAPLEALAEAVRPGTALVAFSSVQSADGRIADLAAVRSAAAAHGARTLLDASQSAGWLPLGAGEWDFTVTGGFKFLLCPRGVSFLTVTEEAQDALAPLHAGTFAAERLWETTYGPIDELAHSARRYDEPPAFLAYHGGEQSLALLEEIGIDAVHAHVVALARRFRAGLVSLGHDPVPGDSAIVAVPGLGARAAELAAAGIVVSARAGRLRAAFHLYNTGEDVDRALERIGSR
ncbi:aminotransferase class V-fold PLP-dependent enzyme [Streptomyces sp. PKU-EA00015]|uniref:aminotransferase class V-fold PLP-dependent enzyme n=1 Tax=Streptomyces sp. PKU-EA00015 TaxID=2748326 RepID=UPI0015A194F1|nr:aminotransferase class V-fold PLP-dependent enzyme [Streptomyces sp. PKU-EA00015]NWF26391.1 aminotransferase class V-fold PLP-dependent enzyme [Streptomyces sp. PKU-EA00015]